MKKKLNTYLLFPVKESSLRKRKNTHKNKGVSLLIAIMSIAMMVGFMADMIITSAVNVEIALASKDKIKSEYLAKSGVNLGVFLFNITWAIDLFEIKQKSKTALEDNSSSYWSMLNSVPPIGANTLELLKNSKEKDIFKVGGIMNEKSSQIMALFEDQFTIQIKDEQAKINVNDCSHGLCPETLQQLIALFSCPGEKKFLSDKGLTPKELAYRIKDFISQSHQTSEESGYNDKNEPYLKDDLNYKVKQLPFDSLEELKMVDGWDDEVHAVFSPYLTVFPINNISAKERSHININTAQPELLTCLIPSALETECYEKFALKIHNLKKGKKAETLSGSTEDITKNLLCHKKDPDNPDLQDPSSWFDKKSWVFNISATGTTGKQSTTFSVMLKRNKPQDKKDKASKGLAQRSYQILSSKIL
jgi:type II secretory pathway component PulK